MSVSSDKLWLEPSANYESDSMDANTFNIDLIRGIFFPAVVCALALAGFEEFFATSDLAYYLVWAAVVGIVCLSALRYRAAYYLTIGLIALSAPFRRDFAGLLSNEIENAAEGFYTLNTAGLGGITAVLFLIAALALVAMTQLFFQRRALQFTAESRFLFIATAVLVVTQLIGTYLFLHDSPIFEIRRFLSDIRLFFVIMAVTICVSHLLSHSHKDELHGHAKLLMFITLAGGFKGLCLLTVDVLSGQFNMYIGTMSYLLMPLSFAFLFVFDWRRPLLRLVLGIVIFIGAFRISRGEILLMLMATLVYFMLLVFFERYSRPFMSKLLGLFAYLATLIGGGLVALRWYSEEMYIFLVFKFRFLTEELFGGAEALSRSPAIRVLEFQNILSDAVKFPPYLFIGKGFGGWFRFDDPEMRFEIGLDAFDAAQLANGLIYRPHLPLNYGLLKGGILYLLMYLTAIVFVFFASVRLMPRCDDSKVRYLLVFFSVFSIYVLHMFWQIPVAVFFAISVVLLGDIRRRANA